MIKKELYPKTKRIGFQLPKITLTEKLDGSNLAFFKLNGELYIAQRKYIFTLEEALTEYHKQMYKGLYNWLLEHGEDLKATIHEKSVINGEWLGMGKLHYDMPNRFYMFAKSNINEEDMTLKNILHDHELFKWCFDTQEIPNYIGVVPVVKELETVSISVDELDKIYEEYTNQVNRNVEGFVINYGGGKIEKYVRMKNGYLEPHHS